MNKETIEQVAKEWHLSKMNNEKIIPGTNEAFRAGTEYAIQQMNNDAVEFAEWAHKNRWALLDDSPLWYNKEQVYSNRSECLTSQQLYQLYLKTKK